MKKPTKSLHLKRTKYGFYQYTPLPSTAELQAYYAHRYYQEGQGSYSTSYSPEEKRYFRLKASLIYHKAAEIKALDTPKSFIDIGCGEGWVLSEFARHGHAITGLDFSIHGVRKFHRPLAGRVEQGDIYQLLGAKIEARMKYDVILLANIIEHVIDPVELLTIIKKIMKQGTLVIIVAPNDFSPLHAALLGRKQIAKPFWLSYPDHLSYFNKVSMCRLLAAKGFRVEAVVADNPIDMNLLNDNSNYIRHPDQGKNTHTFRVRVDNFLASIDRIKLLRMYEILGSMGVGRDLNYYCLKKR